MLAGVSSLKFAEYFPMTRIINLPERRDRRREVMKELAMIGMRPGVHGVEFFDAIRPADQAGFPTAGVRGCFLSHLEVLREAEALGHESVLIIEDDLAISPLLPAVFEEAQKVLESENWGIVYFGYMKTDVQTESDKKLIPFDGPVGCAHFYAVHRRVIPQLIAFLEDLQQRKPGDPKGGPMHYDGALTTFRHQNPAVLSLVANPCLGVQRSSRSDISAPWYERFPVLRQVSDSARAVRSWFRSIPDPGSTT
jgi:hypothetical protein